MCIHEIRLPGLFFVMFKYSCESASDNQKLSILWFTVVDSFYEFE